MSKKKKKKKKRETGERRRGPLLRLLLLGLLLVAARAMLAAAATFSPNQPLPSVFPKSAMSSTFSGNSTSMVSDRLQSFSAVWIDADRDGYEDVFLTGFSGPCSPAYFGQFLYLNNRDGIPGYFTDATDQWLPATLSTFFYYSNVNIVDYNADGLMDIFYGGAVDPVQVFPAGLTLLRNTGSSFVYDGNFVGTLPLGFLIFMHSQWLDYNKDNYVDLLLATEYVVGNPLVVFYHNHGNGTFQVATSTVILYSFPAVVNNVALATADLNNDSYTDFIIMSSQVSLIFRNARNNSFVVQQTLGILAESGSVCVGRFDLSHSYPDIFVTGGN